MNIKYHLLWYVAHWSGGRAVLTNRRQGAGMKHGSSLIIRAQFGVVNPSAPCLQLRDECEMWQDCMHAVCNLHLIFGVW